MDTKLRMEAERRASGQHVHTVAGLVQAILLWERIGGEESLAPIAKAERQLRAFVATGRLGGVDDGDPRS
jgi:hypothetical protein